MNLRFFAPLALLLALQSVCLAVFPREDTFFEEILTVQEKEAASAPVMSSSGLTIPFTRIDVLVKNGIAMTRLIQTYKNNGETNQGYAFSRPISPDTMITNFVIWDQGKRYVGAIEGREAAEEAYKEVTGDEAPTMNRDPGLVRHVGDRYEMRVFPILPGECKQIELITHERLGMRDGKFVLHLPLSTISRSQDPRHAAVESALTQISICIEDELSIKAVTASGEAFAVTKLDDHHSLLTSKITPSGIKDYEVGLALSQEEITSVVPMTFQEAGEQYLMLRILNKTPEEAKPGTGRSYYLGVWESDSKIVNPAVEHNEVFAFPFAAFTTLQVLDARDQFHGSYKLPKIGDAPEMFKSVVTDRKFTVAELPQAMESVSKQMEPGRKSSADVFEHLTNAIEKDGCALVYLFLGDLNESEQEKLGKIVREHAKAEFIFVTDGPLPSTLSAENVSHFSRQSGWEISKPFLRPTPATIPVGDDAALRGFARMANVEGIDLKGFWERLPNLGEMMEIAGTAKLRDVRVFQGVLPQGAASVTPGELRVFWVSGRYDGDGPVQLQMTLNPSPGMALLNGVKPGPLHPIDITANFKLGGNEHQSRMAGAYHARHLVEELGWEVSNLQTPRGWESASRAKLSPESEKKLAELRQEIVRLSKGFSFITAETAFIALPEELLRQYGFTSQEMIASQYYGLASSPAITPEPSTTVLVALGTAVFLFLRRRRSDACLP